MKARNFVMFALIIGLSALMIWLTVAHTPVAASDAPGRFTVLSSNEGLSSTGQAAYSLRMTSEITFTPAFTVYLPSTLNHFGGCSVVPTLLDPADGSTLDTLLPVYRIEVSDNPNITGLRMEVAEDQAFENFVMSSWGGGWPGVHEKRFSWNLDPATTYYWRAWVMCDDVAGPYSEVRSLISGSGGVIPAAPDLVSPADGISIGSLPFTLTWSTVPGALEYEICWRKASGGGAYCFSRNEAQFSTAGAPPHWLDPDTTYKWWAVALNDYAASPDSVSWEFTTPSEGGLYASESLEDDMVTEMYGTNRVIKYGR
jgi:hypothetical protein